jgi:hypothetical protein
VLEDRPSLIEGDTRKPGDDFMQLGAILEVLEEGGDRHASASKDPGPTDALRIALDDGACRPVDHGSMIDQKGRTDPLRGTVVDMVSRDLSTFDARELST